MTWTRPSSASQVTAIAVAAAFAYLVLVGGTAVGETHPVLRGISALLGACVIAVYVAQLPTTWDRFDALLLLSVIAFTFAGLLSTMPRQSLDVLIAALALAAAAFVARSLGTDPASRWAVITAMRVVFLLLVGLTLVRWLPPVVEWWLLTGRNTLPPLDLEFQAHPWGHRHDLTLLIVMLYPSWWVPAPQSTLGKVSALGLGLSAATVVLLDGSRTVWLALGLATTIVVAPKVIESTRQRRLAIPAMAGVGAAVVVGLLTGAFAPVLERLFDFATLGARGAMWTAGIEVWLQSPLAGAGPGTFVWDLQRTDYFDTSSWAPRHPDSVLFQLLPEAGLLGLIAVCLVLVATLPGLLRRGPIGPRWALLAFAFAAIGNSPTDFTFLLVVVVAWVGFVFARDHAMTRSQGHSTWMRGAYGALLLTLALAIAAGSAASFSYEAARSAVASGNLAAAERHLSTALTLDPSQALYARQRGIARYLLGDIEEATTDLERATRTNASDDLAWRSLALARRAGQDALGADRALGQALRAQRSDLTNLLLAASWSGLDGDRVAAREQLSEAVLAAPGLVAAPAWADYVRSLGEDPRVILSSATDRWMSGKRAPAPLRNQPLELVGAASRHELRDRAVASSSLPEDLAHAAVSTFDCAPDSQAILRELDSSLRRLPEYWRLVVAASARAGALDGTAVQVLSIMTGRPPSIRADEMLNPLNENTSEGFSADIWGYERNPIEWPSPAVELPSPASGQQRWITGDPHTSTQDVLCNNPE